MVKTISLKLSFVIAFALFAIFAAQFVFTPAHGQVAKPTVAPTTPGASAPALTPAQEAQLRSVAEGLFDAKFLVDQKTRDAIKALQVGVAQEVRLREQTTGAFLPFIVERTKENEQDIICFYPPDNVTINQEKPARVARAGGLLGLAQILRPKFTTRPSKSTALPFDRKYNSVCFIGIPSAFALRVKFDPTLVTRVLAQSGPALLVQVQAALCPANIQARLENIRKKCKNNNDCLGRWLGALGVQLAKNPKTAKCNPLDLLTPGTPGAGIAVPPTPKPPTTGGGVPDALDFGDARLGFPTTRTENGPRHVLSNRVWFGERIDGENDGLRTNRDDTTGVDDEDGMIQSNPQFIFRVRTGPAVAATVYVNGLEDWNANGRWDINANGAPGDEWIVRNFPLTNMRPNTSRDVALTQPRNGPNGQPLPAAWSDPAFWVRFVVTETPVPSGNIRGQFPSGETEDYIGVAPPVPSQGGGAPAPAPAPANGNGAAGAGHD